MSMILRYTVEGYFTKTFTVSRYVEMEQEAIDIVIRRREDNIRYGRVKYSSFRLYDDSNNLIKEFSKTE